MCWSRNRSSSELSGVLGVVQVRSKTIRGGSELSLEFSPGTDMVLAQANTWNHIGAVRSVLPPDTDLRVNQMTPSVFPIISVVLTGGDNPADLRDYAVYQLAPFIRRIPDVAKADVAGGNIREIVVEARPNDLLQHGLSAADLADQIAKAHRMQPVGRSERPPLAYQLVISNQGESGGTSKNLSFPRTGTNPCSSGTWPTSKCFIKTGLNQSAMRAAMPWS